MEKVCLKRAVRLYVQQAPVGVLVSELKASAKNAGGEVSWTSLAFLDRVASELMGNPVAEQYPPRAEYVSRITKLLLEETENAREESAEGLLRARMACVCDARGGAMEDDTAYESFWLPRNSFESLRAAGVDAAPEGENAKEFDDAAGTFLSFRVSNRDNEVGLRVWEAGRALAEFCLVHSDWLKGKRVVELGAGVGMTGLAVAGCCGAREVVVTDYAPRVLANLRFNVETNRTALNNLNDAVVDVTVESLDWTDYTASFETVGSEPAAIAPPRDVHHREPMSGGRALAGGSDGRVDGGGTGVASGNAVGGIGGTEPVGDTAVDDALGTPEVVLAADVVYDLRYHAALVGVVLETLRRCPNALIIFASTLRNAETMAGFHRCLERAGVPWHHVDFPSASGSEGLLPPAQTQRIGVVTDTTTASAATAERVACSDGIPSRVGARADAGVSETHHDVRKWKVCSEGDGHPQPPPHKGLGLWCHPGDIEAVRFCVCSGGRRWASGENL